jgi:hypothetical protein
VVERRRVTGYRADDDTPRWEDRPQIDTTTPHSARIYNYWLGGKENFAVDREAAEQAIAANPGIVADVQANRRFLARVVRCLAEDGVRQFLDIGTGLPTANNTHEVAQSVAPECRTVYVDNDPIVLTHARSLITSAPQGATAYLDADLRETKKILDATADTLDFGQPVAVMLLIVLHLIPDSDDPYGVVTRLMAAMAPGSCLVISHPASDIQSAAMAEMVKRINDRLPAAPATLRSRAAVSQFFNGLEILAPGVVQPHRWRPTSRDVTGVNVTAWCGAGRKH